MSSMWGNFAKLGDPTPPGAKSWNTFFSENMLYSKSDQPPQVHQLGWHGSRWTLTTISTLRSEMSWLWRGNPGSLRGWISGTTSLATRTEWKLNKLLHTLNNSFSCLSAGLLLILECQQLKTIDGNNILDCLSKETNNSKCKTCSGVHWEKKFFFFNSLKLLQKRIIRTALEASEIKEKGKSFDANFKSHLPSETPEM